jgi:tRNA N6-adenosine threonylcarbamoyltransferase
MDSVKNIDGLVLGIETSCDDTAIALVDSTGNISSSIVVSQTEIHAKFGGIYPEFASRAHVEAIIPTLHRVLSEANISKHDLRAIGVTRGPGLIGSLLVGLNTATGLGMGWNVPVIGINHLRGHLRSVNLEQAQTRYPALILLVSGGHTLLAHMKNSFNISLLGSTRDDSAGEAYDKVGRLLGLGNLGGKAVDELALKGTPSIIFPRPMLKDGLEFSFSGLKSAVSRYLSQTDTPVLEDVAASFIEAIIDVLLYKCRMALNNCKSISLVIVGGVAASHQLRTRAQILCNELGIELCLPPLKWSTDNAAMIALATFDYLHLKKFPKPIPNLQLSICDF